MNTAVTYALPSQSSPIQHFITFCNLAIFTLHFSAINFSNICDWKSLQTRHDTHSITTFCITTLSLTTLGILVLNCDIQRNVMMSAVVLKIKMQSVMEQQVFSNSQKI